MSSFFFQENIKPNNGIQYFYCSRTDELENTNEEMMLQQQIIIYWFLVRFVVNWCVKVQNGGGGGGINSGDG